MTCLSAWSCPHTSCLSKTRQPMQIRILKNLSVNQERLTCPSHIFQFVWNITLTFGVCLTCEVYSQTRQKCWKTWEVQTESVLVWALTGRVPTFGFLKNLITGLCSRFYSVLSDSPPSKPKHKILWFVKVCPTWEGVHVVPPGVPPPPPNPTRPAHFQPQVALLFA